MQQKRSDTPIALMQLLSDMPPLKHRDLTFSCEHTSVQFTGYSFLNVDILIT